MLLNFVWVSVSRDEQANSEEFARVLREALNAGRRWHHSAWMRAITRMLSAVLDEMLDCRLEAERVVTDTAQEIGWSLNLEEQLAVIASNRGEYAKALEIWERVLPKWRSDTKGEDPQPVFGTRNAAIAAGRLKKWNLSADYFAQALERATGFDLTCLEIGMLADRAYALWMGGQRKKAVVAFRESIDALEKLPKEPRRFSEIAVGKLIGHTIAFLALEETSLGEPSPGICSNPNPDKRISQLPETPLAYTWYALYLLAREAGHKEIYQHYVARVRTSEYAIIRMMSAIDLLEDQVKSRNPRGALSLGIDMAIEWEKCENLKKHPKDKADPPGLSTKLTKRSISSCVLPTIWAAMLRAKVLGQSVLRIIRAWRKDTFSAHPYISELLGEFESLACRSVDKLAEELRDSDQPAETRLMAAILLAGRSEPSPNQVIYAETLLIDVLSKPGFLSAVIAESVEYLVCKDVCSLSNKKFLLRMPQVYIPAILKASNSEKRGWPKAAGIMLSAATAVDLTLPPEIHDHFQQLIAEQP